MVYSEKSVPYSLVSRATLGERLVQSVRTGANETIKSVVGEVLSVYVKSAIFP